MYIVVTSRCRPADQRVFTNPLDAIAHAKTLRRRRPGRLFEVVQIAPDGNE